MTSVMAHPQSLQPAQTSFVDFLDTFKTRLQHVFHARSDSNQLALNRGVPPFVMREILSTNPFLAFIPKQYGGRGGYAHESMAVISAASYESLALSLTFGINYALFVQPVIKYAQESIKTSIFGRFLNEQNMGGLMITEPDYGTDALSMQTAFTEQLDRYCIQGTKHWAGLTGWADYWLITARQQTQERGLKRDIDFFICDMHDADQVITVEELFNNLGLYMIPYGRNRIDITVPKTHRLEPQSTGIKMMLDLLHRSRVQFGGMAMGFLHRLMDEAIAHSQQRFVGGKSLLHFDQVQQRLVQLQAAFTVSNAVCAYGSEHAGLERDLSMAGLEANAIKSVITDLMQSSSQSLLQLVGAKGYVLDHIAGRATVDSRPFQIFEGSNDLLYTQISEIALKLMRSTKEKNLLSFLKSYPATTRAADYFKDLLNVEVDLQLPQRKLVELGKALARMITMQMVIELGDRGYRRDLIENCLQVVQQEITGLLAEYGFKQQSKVVEDYREGSSWLSFV